MTIYFYGYKENDSSYISDYARLANSIPKDTNGRPLIELLSDKDVHCPKEQKDKYTNFFLSHADIIVVRNPFAYKVLSTKYDVMLYDDIIETLNHFPEFRDRVRAVLNDIAFFDMFY